MIKGYCDDRFLKIKNIFSNQINSGYELGCSVAVEYKGKEVINLYGGYTDETKTNLWKKNTLVNVWSVTKAITGVCIAKLISENKLDVNNKVSYYWPEYDCNGKSNTKVIDLLTHRAGMFAFEDNYPKCSWNDWEEFTSALEKQKPFREPGLSQGYHAMTFAWLVGEIIRRIDGRMPGDYFKEEIAEPFNLDFHIGLSEDNIHRCADVGYKRLDNLNPQLGFIKFIPNIFLNKDLNNLKDTFVSGDFKKAFKSDRLDKDGPNSLDWRTAQIPAANGHGTAQSLAKLFGILSTGCERDGTKIFDLNSLTQSTKIHSSGPDTVLFGTKLNFGYCFMLKGNENNKVAFAPVFKENAFGHAGIGGSVAFGDAKNEIGYAFVCNRQQKTSELYKTSNLLTENLYKIINN
ncbi:MAG: serine hydrolase domain-containing protein [Pseudomonadota bacterium]|nr:serine hydrolase domain-containing protein [Pseudomonadota bacterium]|tara:strand:+ start:9560 stop:10771 length:1212 start_codon:yes stop_codon:yes gene_type:complete